MANFSKKPDSVLDVKCRNLDKLAVLDRLTDLLGERLIDDLADPDLDDKAILRKYSKIAALVNVAKLKDPDKALSAAEKILDRVMGKPTEKKEVKHRLSELPDEQLDAVLKTKLADMQEEEE